MKSARIVLYLASDAVRGHEDKYALQQQQEITIRSTKICCLIVNINQLSNTL